MRIPIGVRKAKGARPSLSITVLPAFFNQSLGEDTPAIVTTLPALRSMPATAWAIRRVASWMSRKELPRLPPLYEAIQ